MTAKELAKSLGIGTDKGARELLSFLVEAGAAEVIGTKANEDSAPRCGRPANDYKVDQEKAWTTLVKLRQTFFAMNNKL